jgi:hypothetical protein
MPKAKAYTTEEREVAAKAYVSATQERSDGRVVGTDQKFNDFVTDFLTYAECFAPKNCAESTFHKRGRAYWEYTREQILKPIQNGF